MSSSSLTPRAASRCASAHDRVGRTAAIGAAQRRDDAERALVVAAFGDLHVRVVPRRREQARRIGVVDVGRELRAVPAVLGAGCTGCGAGCEAGAGLRKNVSGALVPVCTRSADAAMAPTISGTSPVPRTASISGISVCSSSRYRSARQPVTIRRLARAVLLVLRHLEDRVDRLLLGGVDERAGVHDEHVGFGRVARQLVARLLRQAEHHLGVDEVLGAAEGNETDLH